MNLRKEEEEVENGSFELLLFSMEGRSRIFSLKNAIIATKDYYVSGKSNV